MNTSVSFLPIHANEIQLSGKYGTVPEIIKHTQVFRELYEDTFLSWRSDQPNFFANRSVVIHNSINKTRIACANILTL